MILKKNKNGRTIVYRRLQLKRLVENTIDREGYYCDLNFIDTSRITDMSYLFFRPYELTNFNGDISKWNTENVKSLEGMFYNSKFNGDISGWNTKNVINMFYMFWNSEFNGDISNWDTGNVKYMFYMFYDSPLQDNPPSWYKDDFIKEK